MIYVLCALAFSTAVLFDRNPALEQASRNTIAAALDAIRGHVIDPAARFAQAGIARIVAAVTIPDRPPIAPAHPPITTAAVPKPQPMIIPPAPPLTAPEPTLVAPAVPEVAIPDLQIADAPPAPKPVIVTPAHLPKPQVAPKPQAAALPAPPLRPSLAPVPDAPSAARPELSPGELVRVTMRLKDSLTHEMLDNFGLFLYVSKADSGPWAQRLYVFRKDGGGNLAMLYDWPASTGREKDEMALDGTHQPTITPQGYYQLDPKRMFRNHVSGQWHEPMPYAMFFNWQNKGLETGLAIHGATGLELKQLGTRASAGCIRIAPQNAALLFKLIRDQYKGLAPRFAYDRRTATMSNQGVMMHDASGNLQTADGYKVLVFVENFGGENVVAALF